MNKEQKTIVVTGASSGIGLGLCENLIKQDDFLIYGIDIESSSPLLGLSKYNHIACDLRDFNKTFDSIQNSGLLKKRIFALVNAAGVMPSMLVSSLEPNIANDAFTVNCVAPLYLTKLMLKGLARSKGSSVINLTSIAADIDIPGETVYSSSKVALKSITKSMAIELSRFKIKVNSIAPALIETNMTRHLSGKQKEYMLRKQILDRQLEIKDVVDVIIKTINSPELITGSTLYVGGVVR